MGFLAFLFQVTSLQVAFFWLWPLISLPLLAILAVIGVEKAKRTALLKLIGGLALATSMGHLFKIYSGGSATLPVFFTCIFLLVVVIAAFDWEVMRDAAHGLRPRIAHEQRLVPLVMMLSVLGFLFSLRYDILTEQPWNQIFAAKTLEILAAEPTSRWIAGITVLIGEMGVLLLGLTYIIGAMIILASPQAGAKWRSARRYVR